MVPSGGPGDGDPRAADRGGCRNLLTTQYGTFFTRFADDHRAENFRSRDRIFPATGVTAADDTWEFDRAEQSLPSTYRFEGEGHAMGARRPHLQPG
ncbi:hypothetical protein LTI14_06405 [Nesterenkonia sp. YGD6]|uniref:hypothetical protein n=1 Tax=Nesterenkonia sp. YGD6 TaxID=2901231 RepID=UPI001F4CA564|nr:hypothetical protein [Nesterenkonia sp. YGD6]MCH8562853.1 hypothetical protein [Nesterenkonia sp. YGD6]